MQRMLALSDSIKLHISKVQRGSILFLFSGSSNPSIIWTARPTLSHDSQPFPFLSGKSGFDIIKLLFVVYMEKRKGNQPTQSLEGLCSFLRAYIFSVLSIGPIPRHIAFIMDGNRRYAKNRNLEDGTGHRVGYLALTNILRYCYELNVKYVTIYAFSIDNFKRRPEEVQSTMNLMQEKIEGLIQKDSIVNKHGVRVYFIGNLKLLDNSVKISAERAMKATAHNSKAVLSICMAYTSTDEIMHAIEKSCKEKQDEFRILDMSGAGYGLIGFGGIGTDNGKSLIDLKDVEEHMYMKVAPDPDIIIRTSGETRLSNFLLWQSSSSLLYSPRILWPEIGFWHLVRAILEFQRNFAYLKKKPKQSLVGLLVVNLLISGFVLALCFLLYGCMHWSGLIFLVSLPLMW